mmetsp:Transcript_6246/g.9891  ORF Transcript_6246/g.9891 Transcript_6246/m.9891 type:complete len:114 (-) Transcript_6246:1768-2109(-)
MIDSLDGTQEQLVHVLDQLVQAGKLFSASLGNGETMYGLIDVDNVIAPAILLLLARQESNKGFKRPDLLQLVKKDDRLRYAPTNTLDQTIEKLLTEKVLIKSAQDRIQLQAHR